MNRTPTVRHEANLCSFIDQIMNATDAATEKKIYMKQKTWTTWYMHTQ